jgi:hypothetical protein
MTNNDEISDIIYFVEKINQEKNDPIKVEQNCKRLKVLLLCLQLQNQPTRKIYNIDTGCYNEDTSKEYIKKLKTKYMKEDLSNDQFRTL